MEWREGGARTAQVVKQVEKYFGQFHFVGFSAWRQRCLAAINLATGGRSEEVLYCVVVIISLTKNLG